MLVDCVNGDELKAIYHSKDTVCIWTFKTRIDRNRFMDKTAGMLKKKEKYILNLFTMLCPNSIELN
jgi:hypothetical protein